MKEEVYILMGKVCYPPLLREDEENKKKEGVREIQPFYLIVPNQPIQHTKSSIFSILPPIVFIIFIFSRFHLLFLYNLVLNYDTIIIIIHCL